MQIERAIKTENVWAGSGYLPRQEVLATGFPELDGMLPTEGWPLGALTEILTEREGVGALQLVMPALARLSREHRWLAWIAPPHIPYAPALVDAGIDLSRVLLVHDRLNRDHLWALEQALRSGASAAVLGWLEHADTTVLRRLQLAAEAGNAWGVLFRPERFAAQSSPAALRLRVKASERGILAEVLKCRGGWGRGACAIDRNYAFDFYG